MIEALIEDLTFDENSVPELTSERLKEIASKNPRLTSAVLGLKITPTTPDDEEEAKKAIELADKYLAMFIKPGPCPNCSRKAGFRYSIQHGEGVCRCGYPGRTHHYIADVGDFFPVLLWYHPECVRPQDKTQNS